MLSEWYGKTVYFRPVENGQKWTSTGTAIDIPAYTNLTIDDDGHYVESASGTKYKKAITMLNAFVPDTGSIYKGYLGAVSSNGWLSNSTDENIHIQIYTVNCENFNRDPARYLVDAEGNYRMDSFAWGVCTDQEPDISGKAYWELKNYIAQGYGMMVGHDTLYAYAGAYYDAFGTDLDESSIDPNDTTTPYYQLNTDMAGSWNMNWLMGQNEMYDVANPYDAASMILCCGNWHDKTPLYGDDSGSSTLRVVTRTEGDPFTSVAARCPTNYPYNASFQGPEFTVGLTIDASATHTNMQMAFGTIWVDYASNSIEQKGFGRLMTATRAGLQGTNNFTLPQTAALA